MSTPSSRIWPSSGRSNPAISRSVVVLPQPEGPSSEKNSPEGIDRLIPATAVTSANRFTRSTRTTSPPARIAGPDGSAVGRGSAPWSRESAPSGSEPLAVGPGRLAVEQLHDLAEVLVGLGVVDHREVGVLVVVHHGHDDVVALVGLEEVAAAVAVRGRTGRGRAHQRDELVAHAGLRCHPSQRPVHGSLLGPRWNAEHTPSASRDGRLAACRETAKTFANDDVRLLVL